MSEKKVRLLIGTRKGGYIVESDPARKKWKVASRFQMGTEVFHVAADPRSPGDLYACVNTFFWGPLLYKSTNYGKKWEEAGTPMLPTTKSRQPRFDAEAKDGEMIRKQPITNLWHVEPGHADDPDTLYLGVDPYSLYRSTDRGTTWEPLDGLNDHPTKKRWGAGAGGPCLHTIFTDPTRPKRLFAGISAAGLFRSDDGGESWTPKNHGVETPFLPEKFPDVGQCVHKVAMDPANPDLLYRQDHAGIYISRDAGDNWKRVGKPLGSDFGFVVACAKSLPGRAFFIPLNGESRLTSDGGFQVQQWTDSTKKFTPLIGRQQFPGDFGNHREGLACDALESPGIYAGTNTGQLFFSPNAGKSWSRIPFDFPGIHSVSVANPS